MNHVAIDLGSKASQICVRHADGKIALERKHPTPSLPALLMTWEPSRIILETSSEAFRVADAAISAGHEVRVVPSALARQLGVGERRVKTDERDARKLSEVSCRIDLPSVHIPSEVARRLRSMLRSRDSLVTTRTRSISHVRGWLRQRLLKPGRGTTWTFPERVRALLTSSKSELPLYIEHVLQLIELLNTQLRAANRQVAEEAKQSTTAQRLMGIPGVGPITAIGFIAAIDTPTRFARAHHVQSYLGLTPGENSSSERVQKTGITKAGPTAVRRSLIQAAWAAWFSRPNEPIVKWAQQIAERRGKFIAVVALARKLAGIMFAVWRDDTTYTRARTQKPPT